MTLADTLKDKAAASRASTYMNRPDFLTLDSDQRFEAVLKHAQKKPSASKPRSSQNRVPCAMLRAKRWPMSG